MSNGVLYDWAAHLKDAGAKVIGSSEPRCSMCRFIAFGMERPACARTAVLSQGPVSDDYWVSTKPRSCLDERRDGAKKACGRSARFFEPREVCEPVK